MNELVINDLVAPRPSVFNGLDTWAERLIKDPRDLPFLRLMAGLSLVFPAMAVHLFWPGQFTWWKAAIYTALELYMLGPFILMMHNTSHRVLFKPKYRVLNHYIPWILGPFFGQTPETYFAHHMGMHHAENNLPDDLSTTMPYQRDSMLHFSHYLGRFLLGGLFTLAFYFRSRRRTKLLRRMIVGEGTFWAVVAALMWVNWQAALMVFVVPVLTSRFLMMAGNWAQHAFIDASAPESPYKNSITCINSVYNRRCFNDGYHIGHHVKPNRHWTEMPTDLLQNRQRYVQEGAVVFEKIDYFLIWLFLMLKRYNWLAHYYVPLDGEKRTKEDIQNLLRERTQAFGGGNLHALGAKSIANAVL